VGTVSWTYQASKGNLGATGSAEAEGTRKVRTELHNGWRSMSGEADLGLFGALKIISADVANDPIFGLVGYGCDVSKSGDNYTVSPRDAIGQRINILPAKLYLTVQQDQITKAILSKDVADLILASRKSGAHTNRVSIEGLSAGSYDVTVDGVASGTATVTSGKALDLDFRMNASSTTNIVIKSPLAGVLANRDVGKFSAAREGAKYLLRCGAMLAGEEDASLVLRDASGSELARLGHPFEGEVSWTPSLKGFVVATLESDKMHRAVGSFLAR